MMIDYSDLSTIMKTSSTFLQTGQLCRVCSEPAAGFHFGAFTCEGCKSFFGRSFDSKRTLVSDCKTGGKCEITGRSRTACKLCRFAKCIRVGMSKSGSRYGRRSNWFKLHCILQNDHPKFKSGQIEKQLENDIQLQNVSTTTESPGGVDSSKVSLSPISSPSIVYPTPSTLPDHNSFQTAFTMGINWPPVAYIQGPKIIPTSATYSPHQHSSLVSPLNPHAIRMPSMPISVIKTSPINLGDNKKIWRPPVDSKLWVSPTVSTNETPLDLSLKPLRKLDNVESSPLDLRKK